MIPSSLTNLTLRTCWFGGATKRQSNSMRVDSWKLCIKTLLSVRINIPSGCRSPTNFWQAQTTLGSDFTSLEDSHQQIPTLQQIHSLSKTTTKKWPIIESMESLQTQWSVSMISLIPQCQHTTLPMTLTITSTIVVETSATAKGNKFFSGLPSPRASNITLKDIRG